MCYCCTRRAISFNLHASAGVNNKK
uniref:Uncharacterized protein n=1 Tax=Anguilla anguilla TaxID=7936 RepID=A0A0E9R0M0_ANGAN